MQLSSLHGANLVNPCKLGICHMICFKPANAQIKFFVFWGFLVTVNLVFPVPSLISSYSICLHIKLAFIERFRLQISLRAVD